MPKRKSKTAEVSLDKGDKTLLEQARRYLVTGIVPRESEGLWTRRLNHGQLLKGPEALRDALGGTLFDDWTRPRPKGYFAISARTRWDLRKERRDKRYLSIKKKLNLSGLIENIREIRGDATRITPGLDRLCDRAEVLTAFFNHEVRNEKQGEEGVTAVVDQDLGTPAFVEQNLAEGVILQIYNLNPSRLLEPEEKLVEAVKSNVVKVKENEGIYTLLSKILEHKYAREVERLGELHRRNADLLAKEGILTPAITAFQTLIAKAEDVNKGSSNLSLLKTAHVKTAHAEMEGKLAAKQVELQETESLRGGVEGQIVEAKKSVQTLDDEVKSSKQMMILLGKLKGAGKQGGFTDYHSMISDCEEFKHAVKFATDACGANAVGESSTDGDDVAGLREAIKAELKRLNIDISDEGEDGLALDGRAPLETPEVRDGIAQELFAYGNSMLQDHNFLETFTRGYEPKLLEKLRHNITGIIKVATGVDHGTFTVLVKHLRNSAAPPPLNRNQKPPPPVRRELKPLSGPSSTNI